MRNVRFTLHLLKTALIVEHFILGLVIKYQFIIARTTPNLSLDVMT